MRTASKATRRPRRRRAPPRRASDPGGPVARKGFLTWSRPGAGARRARTNPKEVATMSLLPIESVDADGAIREAEEAVAGDTRAQLFRKAAIGGGALVGGSAFLGML